MPAIVDCVEQPVLAAGGIADGRGLIAALAMGAVGVWMGTRFVASREAYAHINYKNLITDIDDQGTTRTRCFTGKPCRVIKNKTTVEWEGREAEIEPFPVQIRKISEYIGEDVYEASRLHGKVDIGTCAAGQSSALIHEIKGADELVNEIISEAEEILYKFCSLGVDKGRSF